MNEFLPQDTYLGKLQMIEVYDFYDKPILFASRNAAASVFLGLWQGEDEAGDHWLYVGVSPERFEQMRTGQVDLYSAFADAEDGIAFEVHTLFSNAPTQIVWMRAASISAEHLPPQGERLSLITSVPGIEVGAD